MPQKENMAPKGAAKRARSTIEDGSTDDDVVATKKQRVQEETESQEEAPPAGRRAASTRLRKPTSRYDIEKLYNKNTQQQQPQKRDIPPVTDKKAKPQPKRERKRTATPQLDADIYEVPDSDGETDALPLVRKRKLKTAPVGQDQPPKKRRGRPPRSQVRSNDPTPSAAGSPAPTASFKQTSKSRVSRDATETENESTEEALKGSEVRGRKDQMDESRQPKGILTPSQPDAGAKVRKSVAFSRVDSTDDTDDQAPPESPSPSIHEDMRESTPSPEADAEPKSGNGEELEQEQQQEQEDDDVCKICFNPDSTEGNEIMYCDGCDLGFHQECSGVAVIPDGKWYCEECSQEMAEEANSVDEGEGEEPVAVSAEVVPDKTTSVSKGKEKAVVSAEAVLDKTSSVGKGKERAASAKVVPGIPNFKHHLGAMKRVLADRCNGRRKLKLTNLDEGYGKVYQVVEQTIVAGEGNSMLVVGAHGSGKTTLVEKVISDASKEHKDQFHVVRLNGSVHTDDKLAVVEIVDQLGREMGLSGDFINKTKNYADTLTSLLAILSHPTEIAGEAQAGLTSKSVIILLDEFDLFTTHPRQTLLYNLFDIAQARKAPIAVIGLTTRIHVVESLEKRVKSRFSHRSVYLGLPRSLPAYWDICRQGFCIDDEDMNSEHIDQSIEGHSQFWRWWNAQVEALRKTPAFQNRLEYHFYTTKCVMSFLRGWAVSFAHLTPEFPTLKPPGPLHGVQYPDSKLTLLEALSDLDLALLICAARLEILANTELVNFNMAYEEYQRKMAQHRVTNASASRLALGGGARVWGREVALSAWEKLFKLKLLVNPVSGAKTGSTSAAVQQNQGSKDGKMFKVDVALEEIPGAVKLVTPLAGWCTGTS